MHFITIISKNGIKLQEWSGRSKENSREQMPNRSLEDNETLILAALRSAGEKGLSLDEVRCSIFGDTVSSNSLTKKLLEKVKAKGHIQLKIGRAGPYYVINPGH
jgi:hypothetical protein